MNREEKFKRGDESGVFVTEDSEEFEYSRPRTREDTKFWAEQHGEIRTEIIVGTEPQAD